MVALDAVTRRFGLPRCLAPLGDLDGARANCDVQWACVYGADAQQREKYSVHV